MSSERPIVPFKSHIPHYPGEKPAQLPTAETTLLGYEPAVKVAAASADYLRTLESGKGLQAIKGIQTLCNENYPVNYQLLNGFLTEQQQIWTDRGPDYAPRATTYANLQEQITKEFEPPRHFDAAFRFEAHHIRSRAEYSHYMNSLAERMRAIFVPGERNIYFQEDSDGLMAANTAFADGFKKYGTFRRAFAYSAQYLGLRKVPTDAQVEQVLQRVDSEYLPMAGQAAQFSAYQLATMDTIDILNAEGFNIEIMFEKSVGPKEKYVKIRPDRVRNMQDFKLYYRQVADYVRARDKALIEQVQHVAATSSKTEKDTHLFALFGTGHLNSIKLLPAPLAHVSTSSVGEWDRSGGLGDDVLASLVSGQPVDDNLWQAAYNEAFGMR